MRRRQIHHRFKLPDEGVIPVGKLLAQRRQFQIIERQCGLFYIFVRVGDLIFCHKEPQIDQRVEVCSEGRILGEWQLSYVNFRLTFGEPFRHIIRTHQGTANARFTPARTV